MSSLNWLASTIGKRGYIAEYLRAASPSGSRVTGTGYDINTVGFMSCDSVYRVPSIHSLEYIDTILHVCEKDSIDAIVTLSDHDVRALACNRDKFVDKGINCFFPSTDTMDIFGDKWFTYTELQKRGFSVPESWKSLDEALEANPNYPLVIKPRMGSASFGVYLVQDTENLLNKYSVVENPIIQQYLQGRLINVEICSDSDGHPLVGCVWERLSSVDGETALAKTIEHPEALKFIVNVLAEFPVAGPIDVDLVEADGMLHLLEVNTRFGGGYPVSHLAGADFPGAMIKSMSGHLPSDFDRYRRNVTMMKALTPLEFNPSLVKNL